MPRCQSKCVHRWVHAEMSNPLCRGLGSKHMQPSLRCCCVVMGSCSGGTASCGGGRGAIPKLARWDNGGEGGAHLYGFLSGKNGSPCLGGVPRQLPGDGGAAMGSGRWSLWGRQSGVRSGDRDSHVAPLRPPREEERLLRCACDSQLTMGKSGS